MNVRQHIITGEPILYAPGRAGRPHAFGREESSWPCPFCPGNEDHTPAEISRIGDPWRVRAFPNKYPAVEGHEVIVESPQHEATFGDLGNVAEVVAMYVERYRAHGRAKYVSLFRNQGERAGASIGHLHSQLMPLPFVPPRVERESAGFARTDRCPLCEAIDAHRRDGLLINENPAFVTIAPHGSAHAYEQWIVPKRHQAEIDAMTSAEIGDLAAMLRQASVAAAKISQAANTIFMNFPRQPRGHFYVDAFPRLTVIAGFELGTGTFIDIIDPAAAALALG